MSLVGFLITFDKDYFSRMSFLSIRPNVWTSSTKACTKEILMIMCMYREILQFNKTRRHHLEIRLAAQTKR
ncbi:unnamed protein product [Microthlaspi erraticum]|uniref:Uncharacterized protein n=1 Tax=Microthlaspi erraticum TaxID=1685480 RepID=A0A6D2IEV3_9BRAS|nr:unnamed protein product [Microthlaspi erraticum]CAA7047945.1 unnamed protein product [Microthlaspi erraticum]